MCIIFMNIVENRKKVIGHTSKASHISVVIYHLELDQRLKNIFVVI